MATTAPAPNWKLRSCNAPPISQKPATLASPTFAQVRKKVAESRRLFLQRQHEFDEEDTKIYEVKPILEVMPTPIDKPQASVENTSKESQNNKIKLSKEVCEFLLKKEALKRIPSTASTQTNEEQNSRKPTKKISFKIRKNASIYRRKAPEPRLNLVQELTKRYNELDEQCAAPSIEHQVVKRSSHNLKRRPSHKEVQRRISKEEVNTSVRQAIAIFEQKCTPPPGEQVSPSSGAKPQVAAKTFDAKAIAQRNQDKRARLQRIPRGNTASIVADLCNQRSSKTTANNSAVCNQRASSADSAHNTKAISATEDGGAYATRQDKMDACDEGGDELQVVSLPMAVLKRCESNYEYQRFGRCQKTLNKSTKSVSKDVKSEPEASKTKAVINSIVNTAPFDNPEETKENKILEDLVAVGNTDDIGETAKSTKHEVIAQLNENKSKITIKDVRPLSLDDDYEFVVPPTDDPAVTELNTQILNEEKEKVPPLPPRISKLPQVYTAITTVTPPTPSVVISPSITEDDYEIPEVPLEEPHENIYESLSRCSRRSPDLYRSRKSSMGTRNQHEPLPPRPSSSSSSALSIEYENESNYYESIYSKRDDNYESIYGGSRVDGAKRNSISVQSVQSDQQSNSIYGRSITSWAEEVLDTYIAGGSCASFTGSLNSSQNCGSVKAASELSGSSDDWVDISDHEQDGDDARGRNKFVIVRESRHQRVTKKNSGWSQQIRGQWNKVPKKMHHGESDSDHTYETLYDSNGMPIGAQNGGHANGHQPHLPQLRHHQSHEVEGHLDDDDDFDSFESDSESDHSFAKTDSGVDMGNTQLPEPPANQQTYAFTRFAASAGKNVMKKLRRNWSMRKNDISKSFSRITKRKSRTDLDTIEPQEISPPPPIPTENKNTIGRRGFLNKFKRSMSMSGDVGDQFSDRPKSTFYVTDSIDLDATLTEDSPPFAERPERKSKHLVRPQMPPPPAPPSISPASTPTPPSGKSRTQSWYAECGVFKSDTQAPALPRRPNSFWYAEVGLYQSGSPASTGTASSENSGNSGEGSNSPKNERCDDYYGKNYYNTSVKSYDSSDTKKDEAFNSLQGDIQLRLQDEPLYQFYDAAVLESVCNSGLSDVYDDYEEIAKDKRASFSNRPSAMEIVSPRNNVSVARTLWCEIPEVVQSAVLSTLSTHQKKLQEAKFEMLTSEASYLNSLHVLTEHFVKRLLDSDLLNEDDKEILCGKILPVKECSEQLLSELEGCWQENILLHGVCDIVMRHAEENFNVYIAYCENQIILDQALKRLKERPSFVEFLRQLEANSVCQLLTLYSFLMLPMQRITRWPLLIDAILKRLSPQDEEYQSCQYALATLNKIVTRCNEGARNMERITEMRKLAAQMEFARGVPPIELVNGRRWLVRSGALTQLLNRGDDVKLTFGKRFTKIPVHIFLFNDIIIVAKSKGDGIYIVQHYCSRSYLELNSESLATLPVKDTQGRHLLFLTILENHEEKTVEMLLSCASESDRERWMEALTPPKSENPEETLYECWDCPQVTAVHNYIANQPDELPITRGDVINVTRKMADGWYHGERIRDGETGWFPANYTVEVANPHVRARNLKQRYRLLAYSENYLKSK